MLKKKTKPKNRNLEEIFQEAMKPIAISEVDQIVLLESTANYFFAKSTMTTDDPSWYEWIVRAQAMRIVSDNLVECMVRGDKIAMLESTMDSLIKCKTIEEAKKLVINAKKVSKQIDEVTSSTLYDKEIK